MNQSDIFAKLGVHRAKQISEWDAKASDLAHKVDRLQVEVEAREQQVKKMSANVNGCSKRLNGLVPAPRMAAKGTNTAGEVRSVRRAM